MKWMVDPSERRSLPADFNPYAPTAKIDPEGNPLLDQLPATPLTLRQAAVRWTVVCCISAAPSFFWGFVVSSGQWLGMLAGILLFIIGYTLLDYRTANTQIRQRPTVRRTLRITYGTRIAISILFPIGIYLDMVCGALSLGLTHSGSFDGQAQMGFGTVFFTTVVQGFVLNLVLAAYALLVHLVQLGVLAMKGRTS
jgi:hypothetical protein